MSDEEITMPDFEEWAVRLWWDGRPVCQEIKNSLQQAFEQGRALGKRETESEWWAEQDHAMMVADFERASLEDYWKEHGLIVNNNCPRLMEGLLKAKNPWINNESTED